MNVKQEQQKRQTHLFAYVLGFLFFLSALGIALLPTVEETVLRAQQAQAIKQLAHAPHKVTNRLNAAQAELGTPAGVLLLPTLDLKLPIYPGTSDNVLENGIGITEGSGDIRGGKGKNPLLAGHSGLIKNNLFDTLDQLKEKQLFFIKVGDTIHAYRVFRIQEVNAEELARNEAAYLLPQPNKDLVTLMTCTKEDGNASRLLVVGERVAYHSADLAAKQTVSSCKQKEIGMFAVVVLVISWLLWHKRKKNRKEVSPNHEETT